MTCDFCSATPAVRAYRTPDFVLEDVTAPGGRIQRISTEGWAACADCAALIDAGDEEGVIDRSTDRLRRTNPRWGALSRPQARAAIANMQRRFFVILAAVPEDVTREEL
ncbi:MAG TPA: hypothetical protein VFU47_09885 [Armatimonadota bacterium]|nr:hypothetical protein [Armatimonadota bacterium]